MITENDLNISNKSYINKDFASIYEEIVTIAKKLSYKYDPETSNESDPYIVLLKLLAFIGDKLNFNVDKNVLERFLPSATQDTSVRNLCGTLGYNVNYYIAPETKVYIKYTGTEEFNEQHIQFTLPKYETVVTNTDGDITYVTTQDCIITGKNVLSDGVSALQGVIKTLSVLDSEIIQLENIDENRRVYFPEVKVAQNGVFISGGTITIEDDWTKVDNLNTQEIGKYVYKFGYDSSRGLPYIEFPTDIANLIGSGLTIKYIVTDGDQGNVKAKSLVSVSTPTSVNWNGSEDVISFEVGEDESEVLIANNPSASINGSSPETINEAYSGFKKQIGTFETLVTCRDFANYIYQMYDSDNVYPRVSNIQVGDRRIDYNYSKNIVTCGQFGQETISKAESSSITAYDIILYPLKPIKNYSLDEYKFSFKKMTDQEIESAKIKTDIENTLKCISHNYKSLSSSDIVAFKNYLCVEARISTSAKVSATESLEIINNVNTALIKDYNARKVDFGYEIPFDSLLSTIEGADERIKSVSLSEPTLTTKVMLADTDNTEKALLNENGEGVDYLFTLLAKNILSGKIEMFNYDERFDYDYGQTQFSSSVDMINENIKSVTTRANLTIPVTGNALTLKSNEVIQCVAPSLITSVTYPYGINYNLKLNSADHISKDTEYELETGEYCVFEYTNSSDEQVVVIYQHTTDIPTIIRPNVDLYTTEYKLNHGNTPLQKVIKDSQNISKLRTLDSTIIDTENKIKVFTLETNDQVEYRTINTEKLDHNVYCYWIINNSTNTINWDANGKYMLEDGEYFFHTDVGFNSLYSYGSGTVLTKVGYSGESWSADTLSATILIDGGLLSHKEYFKYRAVDSSNYISFLEQQVVTLTENDEVLALNSAINTTNSFIDITNNRIKYKLNGSDGYTEIPQMSFTGGYWKIRERLDIDFGPETPQTLTGNQTMVFKKSDDSTVSVGAGCNICATRLHQSGGGDNIDMKILSYDDFTTYLYETIYLYKQDSAYGVQKRGSNGLEVINVSGAISKTYYVPKTSNRTIIMVYSTPSQQGTVSISVDSGGNIYNYYEENSHSTTTSETIVDGINIFVVTDTSSITIDRNSSSTYMGTLLLGKPSILIEDSNGNHLNSSLGLSNIIGIKKNALSTYTTLKEVEDDLRTKINSIDTSHIFYYNNEVDGSSVIESDNLTSPNALYDYNNVANKWTISEIDFDTSKIQIVKSSLS